MAILCDYLQTQNARKFLYGLADFYDDTLNYVASVVTKTAFLTRTFLYSGVVLKRFETNRKINNS